MKNYFLILFLCCAFSNVKAIESKIIHNIGSEIITNIDIKREFKYLIALNNSLKELDKKRMLSGKMKIIPAGIILRNKSRSQTLGLGLLSSVMYIDSHCHLDCLETSAYPGGLDDILEKAKP